MKRILSILSLSVVLVVLLAACGNKAEIEAMNAKLEAYKDSVKTAADTAGLSDYQAWKAQNELGEYNEYKYEQEATPVNYAVKKSAPARTVAQRSSNQSGSMGNTSGNTAKAKKGWSKSAKGAAIGAGAGAVAGAVINKRNRAVGAVIGGVAGGAVGYGIGRGMDKKDGRF